MKLAIAAAAGLAAGLVGAAAWAALAYFANFEIGWLAWLIGGGVGFAVAIAANAKGGANQATGALAAAIAILAIVGGKFAAVSLVVDKAIKEHMNIENLSLSDEALMQGFASEVCEQRSAAGKPLQWPNGKDEQSAESLADFPAEAQRLAKSRWNSMSPEDQAAHRAAEEKSLRDGMTMVVSTLRSEARSEGFADSFGVIDIVFFLLAIVTAFKVGAMDSTT